MHSKHRLLPKLFTGLLCTNHIMGFMLLTARRKLSFQKTVEIGKWFCKPPSHTCQEQGSCSPGWWGHGWGATQPPKMPHGQGHSWGLAELWMVSNQASSNDCNDQSASVSKLLVKRGRCLQPCLKGKDAEIQRADHHPMTQRWNEVSELAELSSMCSQLSSPETNHSSNKKGSQSKTHYCTVSWKFTSTTHFSSLLNHKYCISDLTSLCFKQAFIAVQSKCQT